MFALSATDVAIRLARQNGTLEIVEREGRFGAYWAICDDHGVIEVHSTAEEANERAGA